MSASFTWSGSAVAALSGQGGIYIESCAPLVRSSEDESEEEMKLGLEVGVCIPNIGLKIDDIDTVS